MMRIAGRSASGMDGADGDAAEAGREPVQHLGQRLGPVDDRDPAARPQQAARRLEPELERPLRDMGGAPVRDRRGLGFVRPR